MVQEGRENKAPSSVHDRIDQLERLVTSLMGERRSSQTSPAMTSASLPKREGRLDSDEDSNELPPTPGTVKLSGDATSYTGSGK